MADRLFSEQAQDEVWRDRNALAAGTYAPVAQAVAVDGGYRVFRIGSFLQRLRQRAMAIFRGHDSASAMARHGRAFFLLRTADIAIDDNWRTMGLCGTGSKCIVADNAFVPSHRALAFAELVDAHGARNARA